MKPANVLLADGPDVSVRLLDFGLALVTEEETLTAAGDVPGTLAYISPERLTGKPAGPATDVWSVGVLLWEALAGRHPFGAGPFLETAKRIGRGAPSLGTARPDLPKPLVALVDTRARPGARQAAGRGEARGRGCAGRRAAGRRGGAVTSAAAPRAATLAARSPPRRPRCSRAGRRRRCPFFPAAGRLARGRRGPARARRPTLGLAFALAVPVLPLGNISLGLAILYGVLACGWLALFWARPRAALLFLAGPLLAPLGALGLLPLAALPAGGAVRRAAQTVAAVLAAAAVAALADHACRSPAEQRPRDLPRRTRQPARGRRRQLVGALSGAPALLLETLALAAAAAAIGSFRRRGPWGAAGFGALLAAHAARRPGRRRAPARRRRLGDRAALALEPGPIRPMPRFRPGLRRISPSRPRLRP